MNIFAAIFLLSSCVAAAVGNTVSLLAIDTQIIDTGTTVSPSSPSNDDKLDAILVMLMNLREDVRSLKQSTTSLEQATSTLQLENEDLQSKAFYLGVYQPYIGRVFNVKEILGNSYSAENLRMGGCKSQSSHTV